MQKTRRKNLVALVAVLLSLICVGQPAAQTAQENSHSKNTKYFSSETVTLGTGARVDRYIISGPPKPPAGYELERAAVALPEPNSALGTKTLTVPAYDWVFGSSAVSGAMIAAYYDRNGYPNMYTGPTNGGVMPDNSSIWGTWSDGTNTYPLNPLVASRNGLDGRGTKGSLDDYWVAYGSTASDPYITGSWTQHAWGDAIGDYMKTSQSAHGNADGATFFYIWTDSASQLTCTDMVVQNMTDRDATYGRKLFYEARGYTVTDCYNQKTDNNAGGFTFALFKAEIDAGRPVLLNLDGQSIVGVGYDNSSTTIYIHDTSDYLDHTMTWGGSYTGKKLLSVSVVNLYIPAGAYSISGTVSGVIQSGVTMTLARSGSSPVSVLTAADGAYSFPSLADGVYTVTPSMSGDFFVPASTEVTVAGGSQTGVDFTAALAHAIIGTVSGATQAGVTMSLTGAATASVTTGADGAYSFVNFADGAYTVTPAKTGYYFSPVSRDVTVAGVNQIEINFTATDRPVHTVSGKVTDGSGQGWPLYATIGIAAPGYSTTAMTDPVTGLYSVDLFENTDFTFTVSSPGYTAQSVTVSIGTGPLTRDFALTEGGDCTALGYAFGATLLSENFDTGITPPALPSGWDQAVITGTLGAWATHAGTVDHTATGEPPPVSAHSTPNLIYFNAYTNPDAGGQARLYQTGGLNLSSATGATLVFWMYHDTTYAADNDEVQVQVSTDGGTVWNNAGAAVARYDGANHWAQHTVDLSAYTGAGKTDVRLAFLGTSKYGNDINIDDVQLNRACGPASGGLVAGTVSSASTGLPFDGVTVQSGATSVVTDSRGVYVFFSLAGIHSVTAVAPTGYVNMTQSVSVTNGAVTGQNFSLAALVSTTTTLATSSSTTTTVEPATTTVPVESTTTIPATTTTVEPATTTTTVKAGPCPAKKALGADNPKLENLRAFRDSWLANSTLGRKFIQIYYANAGSINAALESSPALRSAARGMLEMIAPMVGRRE